MVGGLYKQGDPKRDAGFTIFYMGINIGAFIAPLLCGWLGASYGWHYGFGAAGIGMLAGVIVFWNGSKNNVYGNQGEQPEEFKDKKYFGILNIKHIVYILALASAPLFFHYYFLVILRTSRKFINSICSGSCKLSWTKCSSN